MSQSAIPQQRTLDPTLAISLRLIALPLGGAILFGLAIVAFGLRGSDVALAGVTIVTAVLALAPMVVDQARPPESRQLLLSLIGVGYFVYFCIPALTNYFMNGGTWAESGIAGLVGVTGRDVFRGQVGALLGWICLLLGYMLPIGGGIARRLPQPKREWSHLQSLSVAVVMIPLGWSLVLAGQFGLIPTWAGSGLLGAFAASFYFGIALLTITLLRYRSQPALVLLIIFIPPAVAIGFLSGSKTLALAPLAMVAFTHIVMSRRVRRIWLIGGLLAVVVLYPLAVFQRQIVQAGNRLTAVQVLSNPARTLGLLAQFAGSADAGKYMVEGLQATANRVDALGITSVIMRDTPDRVPFQNGWSIGLIFIAYVPRVLWADKPVTTIGRWVTNTYGPGPQIHSHTGPSWIGELYFNFGYWGIMLGMLIFGIYFRLLQLWIMQPRATIPFILASVVVLWAILMSIDGGLIPVFNNVTFRSIPLVMAHIVVCIFTLPPRSASEGETAPSQAAGSRIVQ